jgi:hypothetical protein
MHNTQLQLAEMNTKTSKAKNQRPLIEVSWYEAKQAMEKETLRSGVSSDVTKVTLEVELRYPTK